MSSISTSKQDSAITSLMDLNSVFKMDCKRTSISKLMSKTGETNSTGWRTQRSVSLNSEICLIDCLSNLRAPKHSKIIRLNS